MIIESSGDWRTFRAVQTAGLETMYWSDGLLSYDASLQTFRLALFVRSDSGSEIEEALPELSDFIKRDKGLKELGMNLINAPSEIGKKLLKTVCVALSESVATQKIKFSLEYSFVYQDQALIKMLQHCDRLRGLSMLRCTKLIGKDEANMLVSALKENKDLEELCFQTPKDSIGITMLSGIVKANASVKQAKYEGRLDQEGGAALAEALAATSTLHTLDLLGTTISSGAALILVDSLKANRSLSRLSLVNTSLGVAEAAALAGWLKDNETLQEIDLSSNRIGSEGATVLASVLKENCSLTTMGLYETGIDDMGVMALAGALQMNKTVSRLDLEGNSFATLGVTALDHAMTVNSTLVSFGNDDGQSPYFADNSSGFLTRLDVESLENALFRNEKLADAQKRLAQLSQQSMTASLLLFTLSHFAEDECLELSFAALKHLSSKLVRLHQVGGRKRKAPDACLEERDREEMSSLALLQHENAQLDEGSIHLTEALEKLEAKKFKFKHLPGVRNTPDWKVVARELSLTPLQLLALKSHRLEALEEKP